jgi:hypothetical protein
MSNFPEDRPKDRGIVKLSSALQQAPFTIVIAPISIICGAAGIAAAVLMPFWQSLIIIVLLNLLIIAALWHRFPVTQRFPPIESRILLLLMIPLLFAMVLSTTLRNKYLKEYPPPSVVYVVPGAFGHRLSAQYRDDTPVQSGGPVAAEPKVRFRSPSDFHDRNERFSHIQARQVIGR